MKEHRFYFEGSLVRVYEQDDGCLNFNLEDVAKALKMTPEEALEILQDLPGSVKEMDSEDKNFN